MSEQYTGPKTTSCLKCWAGKSHTVEEHRQQVADSRHIDEMEAQEYEKF